MKVIFGDEFIFYTSSTYVWNLPTLSLAWFFFLHIEFRTMCWATKRKVNWEWAITTTAWFPNSALIGSDLLQMSSPANGIITYLFLGNLGQSSNYRPFLNHIFANNNFIHAQSYLHLVVCSWQPPQAHHGIIFFLKEHNYFY